MNNDTIFGLLVAYVFSLIPKLGGIGTKDQYLVTLFEPIEGESIPDFHLPALQGKREIYVLDENIGNKN